MAAAAGAGAPPAGWRRERRALLRALLGLHGGRGGVAGAGGPWSDAELDGLDAAAVCDAVARGVPVELGAARGGGAPPATPSAAANPFLREGEAWAAGGAPGRPAENDRGATNPFLSPEAAATNPFLPPDEAATNPFLSPEPEEPPAVEEAAPALAPPGGASSSASAPPSPCPSDTTSATSEEASAQPLLPTLPEEDLRLLGLQMYIASYGAADEPHVDLLASQLEVSGAYVEGVRAVLGQAGVCSGGLFRPGWGAARAVSGESLLQVFLELSQSTDEPLPEHLSRLREVAVRGLRWVLECASREASSARAENEGGSASPGSSADLALSRAEDFLREPGKPGPSGALAAALAALGSGQLGLAWAQKFALYEALLPACFDLLEESTLSDDFDDIVADLEGAWTSFGVDRLVHEAALVRVLLERYSLHEQNGPELLLGALEKVEVLWDVQLSTSLGGPAGGGGGEDEDDCFINEDEEEERLLCEAVQKAEVQPERSRGGGRAPTPKERSPCGSGSGSDLAASHASRANPRSPGASRRELPNDEERETLVRSVRRQARKFAARTAARLGASSDGGLRALKSVLGLCHAANPGKPARLQACGRAYLMERAKALAPGPGPGEEPDEVSLCTQVSLLRTVLDEALLLKEDYYRGDRPAGPTISLAMRDCGERVLGVYPQTHAAGTPGAAVDGNTVKLIDEVSTFEFEMREHARTMGFEGDALEAIALRSFWGALQVKIYSWAALQVENLERTCKRMVDIEDWRVTPPGSAAPANSAIELLRLTSSFLDNGLGLGPGMPVSFIHIITQSVSSTVQIYCERVVAGLCERGMDPRGMFMPPVPQLMRFKEKQHLQMCDERSAWVAEPWELGEAQLAAIEVVCVKVNSLWHVQEKLTVMEASVKERWRELRGEGDATALDGLDFFEEAYRALERQREWLASYSAARHVFMDMKRPFIDELYLVSVRKCRMSHVLSGLEQYLQAVAELSLTDRLRDLFARELLKAALDALEVVLLDGGNFRVFGLKDSLMLERDLGKLQDLFFADGEGLDMGDIDALSQGVSSILTLLSVDTEAIIENFRELHVRCSIVTADWDGNRDPRKNLTEDPATFLRILCHRGERNATKFLKDAFPQLETMVADESKIGRQRFQTMKNVVRRKVSQILNEKEESADARP